MSNMCTRKQILHSFRLIKSSHFSSEIVCFEDNNFQDLNDNSFQWSKISRSFTANSETVKLLQEAVFIQLHLEDKII